MSDSQISLKKLVSELNDEQARKLYELLRKRLHQKVADLSRNGKYHYAIINIMEDSEPSIFRTLKNFYLPYIELFRVRSTKLPQILTIYNKNLSPYFECNLDYIRHWNLVLKDAYENVYREDPEALKIHQALLEEFGPSNKYTHNCFIVKTVDQMNKIVKMDSDDINKLADTFSIAKSSLKAGVIANKEKFELEIDGKSRKFVYKSYDRF